MEKISLYAIASYSYISVDQIIQNKAGDSRRCVIRSVLTQVCSFSHISLCRLNVPCKFFFFFFCKAKQDCFSPLFSP